MFMNFYQLFKPVTDFFCLSSFFLADINGLLFYSLHRICYFSLTSGCLECNSDFSFSLLGTYLTYFDFLWSTTS